MLVQTFSKKQRGLSLIELMISITLGMILIAAATSTLLDSQRSYKTSDNVNRAQETGRLAMNILVKHIRLGGYIPYYKSGEALAPGIAPKSISFSDCSVTIGSVVTNCFSEDGTHTAPVDSLAKMAAQSDSIVMEYDVPSASKQVTVPANGNTPATTNTVNFDTLCNGVTVDASTTTPKMNDILTTRFFISAATNTVPTNSLSCQVFNRETLTAVGSSQRLVDGVDAMQIKYGVKNNDGNIQYLNASQVNDGDKISSVKVALLVSDGMSGSGGLDSSTRNYNLLGAGQIALTDNKKRYVYTTTVYLNNSANGGGI